MEETVREGGNAFASARKGDEKSQACTSGSPHATSVIAIAKAKAENMLIFLS